MSKHNRKYHALPIYEQLKLPLEPEAQKSEKTKSKISSDHPDEFSFYEIEYDSCPMPGVGKYVRKTKKAIPAERIASKRIVPEKDEFYILFQQMRDIARANRSLPLSASNLYTRTAQAETSRIFYKQATFMKDFEDNYASCASFSSYFPNYQVMSYEQLRTYFSWRTQVRQGNISGTFLSYAFLYIYELLNNIGTDGPEDGLTKLMAFWDVFRIYDRTIDKYILRWLKDYHIYYSLPQSFPEFIRSNGLDKHYPELAAPKNKFQLYCSISKYDIQKSNFYTEERSALIQECFSLVVDRLAQACAEKHIILDDLIFQPSKNLLTWIPFKGALFFPHTPQPDRRIVLSDKEIYLCIKNNWKSSTNIAAESGMRLIGYLLKQMEAILRKEAKYKYKLSADMRSLSPATAEAFQHAGIDLERTITAACLEYCKLATKTVVQVNLEALDKIRQESFLTQEKLIVPEQEELFPVPGALLAPLDAPSALPSPSLPLPDAASAFSAPSEALSEAKNPWDCLKSALTSLEIEALQTIQNAACIEDFACAHHIMPEILADGINEKAADWIGDSIIDNAFAFYEDYAEQIKKMLE